MLKTAKVLAKRSGSTVDSSQMNGLTFGQFCVLVADLKRFRMSFSPLANALHCDATDAVSSKDDSEGSTRAAATCSDNNAPEVFLGGSCNPTTWRADVAIPTLNKLGISFYNPVSDEAKGVEAAN